MPTKIPDKRLSREIEEMKEDIFLLDRACVIFDGACDCPKLSGKNLPECRRYTT